MYLLYKADQHSQVLDCITLRIASSLLAYYHPPANLYALSFSAIMFLFVGGCSSHAAYPTPFKAQNKTTIPGAVWFSADGGCV